MAKGGKRIGAGRKPGPAWKPFRDYINPEERAKFIQFILESYMGDMRLALWFGEQLFGKAPASLDITTDGQQLPTPIMYVPADHGDQAGSQFK
jgi:hypothetical protein